MVEIQVKSEAHIEALDALRELFANAMDNVVAVHPNSCCNNTEYDPNAENNKPLCSACMIAPAATILHP